MNRFLKLILIIIALFIVFSLSACDTVLKSEYDKMVKELDSLKDELNTLKEVSVDKVIYEAKLAELEELKNKLLDIGTLQNQIELLNEIILNLKESLCSIDAYSSAEQITIMIGEKELINNQCELKRAEIVTLKIYAVKNQIKTDITEWHMVTGLNPKDLLIDKVYSKFNRLLNFKITPFNEGEYVINVKSSLVPTQQNTFTIKVVNDIPEFNDVGKTKVVIGSTMMQGSFISGFGNSESDVSIGNLIHGYDTVWMMPDGNYIWDTQVVLKKEPESYYLPARNVQGIDVQDKVFCFELNQSLEWSDSTPIKAKDYVFSLLFYASLQWHSSGERRIKGEKLLGYQEYRDASSPLIENGSTPVFKGVKIINDYSFELTINGESLPNYYELRMLSLKPAPMHIFAPEASVVSDAEGSYLTGLTNENVEWVKNSYSHNPTITCGPYQFIFFQNQIVRLEKNPNYLGDGEGYLPTIDIIEQRWINSLSDVEQLIEGKIDLISYLLTSSQIQTLENEVNAFLISYPNNHFTTISFACDFGPTKDSKVRQALGMLINNADIQGIYNITDWMYQLSKTTIEENLLKYHLDINKANEYLNVTEWIYEKNGVQPFDITKAGIDKNYWRYNSKGEKLIINHATLNSSSIQAPAYLLDLPKYCAMVGIDIQIDYIGFSSYLDHYYYGYSLGNNRKYHSFCAELIVDYPFEPYYYWHSYWLDESYYNINRINDQLLDRNIEAMNNAVSDSEYLEAWNLFQKRMNELLPNIVIPKDNLIIASSSKLKSLKVTYLFDWSKAITRLSID